MIDEADLLGLDSDQARRCETLHREVETSREAIAVWHRLLDRRRLDRKLGLHPIPEFGMEGGGRADHGRLARRPDGPRAAAEREPFRVKSENEARAILLRCIGYLSNAEGKRLAFDKGIGDRDKMAEWIAKEISERGAISYIRRHAPFVFGIPLVLADS